MGGRIASGRHAGVRRLTAMLLAVGVGACAPALRAPYSELPESQPSEPDDSLYFLPYTAGTSSLVGQGNFGPWSHQNEYALDFLMPMHTPILAARGGVVVQADDSHTETCWLTKDCKGNRVIIEHADGTRAKYWHIEHGGNVVAVNDRVRRGELIAYSGQTGIAIVPHLHFSVIDPNNQSIEVRFAEIPDNNGVPVAYRTYTSRNQE